jgi:hypothetical protein
MDKIDIFKDMEAHEIERIITYYDRVKRFSDEHGEFIFNLKNTPKDPQLDNKPIDPKEMWEINSLIRRIEDADLDEDLEIFEKFKYSTEIYNEMIYISKEGCAVSAIFKKYKLKTAKSLFADITRILEMFRLEVELNPEDADIKNQLAALEKEYTEFQNSMIQDELILENLKESSEN